MNVGGCISCVAQVSQHPCMTTSLEIAAKDPVTAVAIIGRSDYPVPGGPELHFLEIVMITGNQIRDIRQRRLVGTIGYQGTCTGRCARQIIPENIRIGFYGDGEASVAIAKMYWPAAGQVARAQRRFPGASVHAKQISGGKSR